MKRYYVCPKSVWCEIHECGEPYYALMASSSYLEIDATHILLITDFASDWAEAIWHQHPEVARLAHPIHECNVPLYSLCADPNYAHKQFTEAHWQKLVDVFGLEETDTVWDLHSKLKDLYPGMKLSSGY